MKKIAKMIGLNLVIAISALILLPVQAWGVDVTRVCDITLVSACDGEKVPNAQYRVYHLADITGNELKFEAVERFQSFPEDFACDSQEDWSALAETLKGYVDQNGFTPDDSVNSGSEGSVTISGLRCGLYLVVCEPVVDGDTTYKASPFCIAVPQTTPEGSDLQYSVTAKPKFTKETHTTPTVEIKVAKYWNDASDPTMRPSSIQITLNKDGSAYDTVTLTKDSGWTYSWKNLPADGDYSVYEATVEKYTCTVEHEGNVFKVTNTLHGGSPHKPQKPTTPSSPRLPQTGQLWWPVVAFAVSGLVLVLMGMLMRRIKRHD